MPAKTPVKTAPKRTSAAGEARLQAALRENLAKRKAQARARTADTLDAEPPEETDER